MELNWKNPFRGGGMDFLEPHTVYHIHICGSVTLPKVAMYSACPWFQISRRIFWSKFHLK